MKRVTRNKPPKIEEMSKEQIRKTIMKKRETNARAQSIVESLLDSGVSEDSFLSCLPHINQSHLDDVIEERALAHMCGYPPCRSELTVEDIPRQQYRISTKTNKVYDITMRKNFCSNRCYKATTYVKKQMLTSPLWFREYEEIPTFNLISADTVPSMGQEVDLSITEKLELKNNRPHFTSINEFASASFNKLHSEIESPSAASSPVSQHEDVDAHCREQTQTSTPLNLGHLKDSCEQFIEDQEPITTTNNKIHVQPSCINSSEHIGETIEMSSEPKKMHVNSIRSISANKLERKTSNNAINPLSIVGEIIERPEKKIDPIITSGVMGPVKETAPRNKEDTITAVIIHVEKCIAEWFTVDSMILLFGEAEVKKMVADKGDCIKEYLNNMANGLLYSSTSYDQYQQLCRKLNMLELEDHRYDSKFASKETKPLPDYSILQNEGKRMELKVRTFLSGECEIPEPNIVSEKQPQEENPSLLTQLALVDNKAQNALRRKILLTNLNKVLHDLQLSLGLQEVSIASDVRLLVNSFKLKADNIMFKPIQWTLIGVIVIKLLSLRDARIQQSLETSTANRNLQLLLLSYKQDGGYLDRLLSWLTDVDRLLDINYTHLTMVSHANRLG